MQGLYYASGRYHLSPHTSRAGRCSDRSLHITPLSLSMYRLGIKPPDDNAAPEITLWVEPGIDLRMVVARAVFYSTTLGH